MSTAEIKDVKQQLDRLKGNGTIDDWRHQWGEVQVLKRGEARSMTWQEAQDFVAPQ